MSKILIDLDEGFLARIERERYVAQNTTGKRPPRTAAMRALLLEAMDARCTSRGEEIPEASPEADRGQEGVFVGNIATVSVSDVSEPTENI